MPCETCKGDPRGRLVVIHLAGERAWWFEPCPDCTGGPNAASCCDGLQAQPEHVKGGDAHWTTTSRICDVAPVKAGAVALTLWLAASAAFAAPLEVLPGGGQTTLRQECHHNRAHQLVCSMCWHEHGRVRCNAPRIVR